MELVNTVAPASNPVTTAEAKTQLNITHSTDDTLIAGLISSAVALLDGRNGFLRRALMPQTWTWTFDNFPACDAFELPFPPLQSVTSITYKDANGDVQTLATSVYEVVTSEFVGKVRLKNLQTWPVVYTQPGSVTVTFVAGYADASAVPAPIKHALKLIISRLYGMRGDEATEASAIPDMARHLLEPYRVRS